MFLTESPSNLGVLLKIVVYEAERRGNSVPWILQVKTESGVNPHYSPYDLRRAGVLMFSYPRGAFCYEEVTMW